MLAIKAGRLIRRIFGNKRLSDKTVKIRKLERKVARLKKKTKLIRSKISKLRKETKDCKSQE